MCARYELVTTQASLIDRFGLTVPSGLAGFDPRADIYPTNAVPAVTADQSLAVFQWGLEVPWQKQPLINARLETVADKPTFKPLVNERVLIPATAYFEWRKEDRQHQGRKIKTRIALPETKLFAMAGLVADDRFVLLTCSPAPEIAHIHNRMPVIVPKDMELAWLNPDTVFEDLMPDLKPYGGPFSWSDAAPPQKQPQQDLFS